MNRFDRPFSCRSIRRLATPALLLLLAAGLGCAKHPAGPPPTSGAKPLFYRHPMQPDITSLVPAKDDMGMDYIPVYPEPATSDAQGTSGSRPTAAAPALSEASLALGGIAVVPVVREPIARSVRLPGVVAADEARRTEVMSGCIGWR